MQGVLAKAFLTQCGRMTQGGFETYDSWVMKGIDDAVEDFTSQPVKKGIIVMSMITDGVTYESVADGRYEDAFRNVRGAIFSPLIHTKFVCVDRQSRQACTSSHLQETKGKTS